MEDSAAEPISDDELEEVAGILRDALGSEMGSEMGFEAATPSLRIDAGEKGRVWVALRDGEGDVDEIESVARGVDEALEGSERLRDDLVWRVSIGGIDDPVVVCEFAEPPDPDAL